MYPKKHRPLLKACAACALVAGALAFSGAGRRPSTVAQTTAQDATRLPVAVTQLPSADGVPPVSLRCEDAELSAANAIEKIPCFIKNNSNKQVSAANIAYSVTTAKGGREAADLSYLTIETFVHPDLRAARADNRIPPHGESPIGSTSTTYDDAVVTALAVWIDYVEFEDGTTLGQDRAGSRILSGIRSGAAKYKAWLADKYKQKGNSIEGIVPLIEGEFAPGELGIQNGDEEQGATIYQNYARRVRLARGERGLGEFLKLARDPKAKTN
jgi:hypothetical protein